MASSMLGRLVRTAAIPFCGAVPPLADSHASRAMHPTRAANARLRSVWLVVDTPARASSPAKAKAMGRGRS